MKVGHRLKRDASKVFFEMRSIHGTFLFSFPALYNLNGENHYVKCLPLFGSARRFSASLRSFRSGLTTITGTGECARQYLQIETNIDSAQEVKGGWKLTC